jgi:hypothetical protein
MPAADIAAISRYVVSLQSPDGPAPAGLRGDPVAGEAVFFMHGSVRAAPCAMPSRGAAARWVPTSWLRWPVSLPSRSSRKSSSCRTAPRTRPTDVALTTKTGSILTGIKSGETATRVLLRHVVAAADAAYHPKGRHRRVGAQQSSVMPNDYASRLTLQQLLDVVAFLKQASGDRTPVTLADVAIKRYSRRPHDGSARHPRSAHASRTVKIREQSRARYGLALLLSAPPCGRPRLVARQPRPYAAPLAAVILVGLVRRVQPALARLALSLLAINLYLASTHPGAGASPTSRAAVFAGIALLIAAFARAREAREREARRQNAHLEAMFGRRRSASRCCRSTAADAREPPHGRHHRPVDRGAAGLTCEQITHPDDWPSHAQLIRAGGRRRAERDRDRQALPAARRIVGVGARVDGAAARRRGQPEG